MRNLWNNRIKKAILLQNLKQNYKFNLMSKKNFNKNMKMKSILSKQPLKILNYKMNNYHKYNKIILGYKRNSNN